VRAALALLAFWALWFAQDRFHAFTLQASANFSYDNSLWLLSLGATVAARFLFGLAAWLPFTRIRYLPSRLLLAVAALLPVAHFWWIVLEHHEHASGLWRGFWFDVPVETQFVLAGLAGVAIASGSGPRSSPRDTFANPRTSEDTFPWRGDWSTFATMNVVVLAAASPRIRSHAMACRPAPRDCRDLGAGQDH
jgi:hypothetical protein